MLPKVKLDKFDKKGDMIMAWAFIAGLIAGGTWF